MQDAAFQWIENQTAHPIHFMSGFVIPREFAVNANNTCVTQALHGKYPNSFMTKFGLDSIHRYTIYWAICGIEDGKCNEQSLSFCKTLEVAYKCKACGTVVGYSEKPRTIYYHIRAHLASSYVA